MHSLPCQHWESWHETKQVSAPRQVPSQVASHVSPACVWVVP